MELTKNKYYFEAIDNYPYDLPASFESLNYALSYDPEDADSLCLMGRIYAEQLKDYEMAKQYFEEAMQTNLNNINTPQFYILCLLNNEDLDEAKKLIKFALGIKGIDKATILNLKSSAFEIENQYKKALKTLKKAKKFCYNSSANDFIENRIKLIKSKLPKKKKKGKRK